MKTYSSWMIIPMLPILFHIGSCKTGKEKKTEQIMDLLPLTITQETFGQVNGQEVSLFTLKNLSGMKVCITNYGGIITHLWVPDGNGNPGDVVLGYDSLSSYIQNSPYFGAIVGRYANRIAKGRFSLDGKTYTLATNNGPNHLHGGIRGFDKVVWNAEVIRDTDYVGVKLKYRSPDGEEGYPGNLEATVTYTLAKDNQLSILFEAQTDKATPVNLSNHSYFNLTCADSSILGHELLIPADRFTVVDHNLIPTGELKDVRGNAMDFTTAHLIGEKLGQVPGGYDHNYVLNKQDQQLSLAANLFEPRSGRVLEIFTTEPGVQFYSGNFLDGTITGKNGKVYEKHWGLCLETQHFPDSPNQKTFPSTILRPGELYRHEAVYRFSVK